MQHLIDLARLAEGLDSPYRPVALAETEGLRASLFVCDDRRSWHRDGGQGSLLFILDGVVIIETGGGRTVANEGELLRLPRQLGHSISAGMRSTVLLFEPGEGGGDQHLPPGSGPDREITKVNAAAEALRGQPFHWLDLGDCGSHGLSVTRLWGSSEEHRPGAGPLLLVVYRGVMDYRLDEEEDVAVGSQLLLVPAGRLLRLRAERGATVLALCPRPDAPPSPAAGAPPAP